MKELYKYQGAGNDFVVIDGRKSAGKDASWVDGDFIRRICDRRYGIGADGLMILEDSEQYSFKMIYYNSDGTGGMMCGNGGRCITAFALKLGITDLHFEAADGPHEAELISAGEVIDSSVRQECVIRLKLKDVSEILTCDERSYFLDTGTRHFIRFVDDVASTDVVGEGRIIRYRDDFAPIGTNVDFVQPENGRLRVRTYEKGVEDETYACGTGIVASCIAAWFHGVKPSATAERVRYDVSALRDELSVDFIPGDGEIAKDVWLTGPAVCVACIIL